MQTSKFLYSFRYHDTERELCTLEIKSIFKEEETNKLLFSNIKIEPSSSAFIKTRIDIISSSEDYSALIRDIKKEKISIDDFKVEYIVFDGDTTEYPERLSKLKDIGFSIDGNPDYHNPTTTYSLCIHKNVWYFGQLIKNKYAWYKHNKKPRSFSNSISINIAKSLVNIATKGDKEKRLLDACCGVGTIMLEACFAGYHIEGNDISYKIVKQARENLIHFNYNANITCSDIKDINEYYDAAIIDLPYNLYSKATEEDIVQIIDSAAKITNRLVIASISDITNMINDIGFEILDLCSVKKIGKTTFTRKIWVCEKNE